MKKYTRHELEAWHKRVHNLDRDDLRKEATQRLIKHNYRESKQYDQRIHWQFWHSRPDRNCPGWMQKLQRMSVEKLVKYLESM